MSELNISELIAKPLFAEGGIGDRLFKAYHAYAEDYILATEGPDYAPTEFERELIEDFINGLFSDEQFLAPIRALLSSAEAAEERLRSWERQWPTYVKLMQEHVARTEFLLALALAALDQRAVKIAELVGSAVRTERALQAAETRAQQAEALWARLSERPNLSLEHCSPVWGDVDDDAVEWRVHRESGNINDREWELVGAGPTALAAVQAARQALGASHG